MFLVKVDGVFIEVEFGIILGSGKKLAWWHGKRKGIANLGDWKIAPRLLNDPTFKDHLWQSLTADEKQQSLLRRFGSAGQAE